MANIKTAIITTEIRNLLEKFDAPEGKGKVTKFYIDLDTGKLIIEYDDLPIK